MRTLCILLLAGVLLGAPLSALSYTVTVISPNGGENWQIGTTQRIQWSYSGTFSSFDLHVSRNGGSTWSPIETGLPGNYTYRDWTVTVPASSSCRIRVTGYYTGGSVQDASNSNFTISDPPTITVTSPNGGETWYKQATYNITWSTTGSVGNVLIHLYRGGTNVLVISANTFNDGSYSWTVPTTLTAASDYRIGMAEIDGDPSDFSNNYFTIANATITVTSPNGGENWRLGETHNITWTTTPGVGNLQIHLYRGGTMVQVLSASYQNVSPFSWTISGSLTPASDYRIGMSEVGDGDPSDFSNNYFTLSSPTVTVSVPNGGENWQVGTTQRIQWSYSGTFSSFDLHISRDGGSTWSPIETGLPGNYTYRDWTVTGPASSSCRIRVTGNIYEGSVSDQSNANFTIIGTINVTFPTPGITLWKGHTYHITWTWSGVTGNVRVQVLRSGSLYYQLAANDPNDGDLEFEVPFGENQTPGYNWPEDGNYQVRVEALNGSGSANSGYFSILRPTISVTFPNGGQTMYRGQTIDVTWSQNQVESNQPILLQWYHGSTPDQLITASAPNTGSYSWTIPCDFATGMDYRIAVSAYNGEVWDFSDGNNTIAQVPATTPVSPAIGGTLQGPPYIFTWNPVSGATQYRIKVSTHPDMSSPIFDDDAIPGTQTSYTYNDYLQWNLVHYWQVCALRYGCWGAWPTVWNFTPQAAPMSITVTSPNGGEIWSMNEPHNITWTTTGPVGNVQIHLYRNSPSGPMVYSIAAGAPNTGSLEWTIPPEIATHSDYLIGISQASTGDPFDFSDAWFTINGASLSITSPNGGETLTMGQPWQIQWTSTGNISTVHVELYQGNPPNGEPLRVLHGGTPNTGSLWWNPVDIDLTPACNYYLAISDDADGDPWDFSNGAFCIENLQESITVTSPNGGENWQVATTQQILWSSVGTFTSFDLHISRNGGSTWTTIETGLPGNYTYRNWTVTSPASTSCRMRVTGYYTGGSVQDASNANFTITDQQTLTVLSPNGGEFWQVNQSYNITWSSSGAVGNVLIHLYRGAPPHGTFLQSIINNTQNDGLCQWTVWPWLEVGSDYYIGIADVDNEPWDYSNAPFMIQHPCVDGEISGYVDNPDGERVSGATVTVQRTDVPGSPLNAQTNANGEFLFSNLALGTYSLRATHPEYEQALVDAFVECRDEENRARANWIVTLFRRFDLDIESVQAYQTVRYSDSGDSRLIAGKPTVVIATVRETHASPRSVGNVTGKLWIINGAQESGPFNSEWPQGGALPGYTVKSNFSYTDMKNWEDGLYFIITDPDSTPQGQYTRFRVRLDRTDQNNGNNEETSGNYTFVYSLPLTVHIVPVFSSDYRSLPPATYEQIREDTRNRMADMFPYTEARLSFTLDSPISDLEHESDERELTNQVILDLGERAADGPGEYFVAVFPACELLAPHNGTYVPAPGFAYYLGAPLPYDRCCFVAGATSTPLICPSMPTIVMHELGHSIAALLDVYGRCDENPSPCALDQWGLSTRTTYCLTSYRGLAPGEDPGSLYSWIDLMGSNRCKQWVRWDPTYRMLRERALPIPLVVRQDEPTRDTGPYCMVSGMVGLDSTVFGLKLRNSSGSFAPTAVDSGAYRIDWWNSDPIEILQTVWMDPTIEGQEVPDQDRPFWIVASRPLNAGIVTLSIGDYEIARIEASENAPTVNVVAPNGTENLTDSTVVVWSATDPDGDSLCYDLFAKRDAGDWEVIATGLRSTSTVWYLEYFPGTNAGRIKVMASDGWHTAVDSSDGTFTIAAHDPVAYIESPQDTAAVLATSYVSLSGWATDLEDGNLPGDSLVWSSNLNGFLGRGSVIQAANLSPGMHLITLSAADNDGNLGFDSVYVQVLADADQDGMDDGWESAHGLNPSLHDAYTDLDLDQLMNGQEYALGTYPNNPDTDGDTYGDGQEVAAASDPLDPASIPNVTWVTPPAGGWALIPNGQIGFNDALLFSWNAATADDSLRPLSYEVHVDSDPNFSNPLVAPADTQTTVAALWQLPVGIVYLWKVKVTDTYGHWIWSDVASITRASNPQVPVRITDLTVIVTANGLQFDWSPVTIDTAGNPITVGLYIIYGSPALDQPYLPIAYTSTNTWTDTEALNLQWPKWFYAVEASTDYSPPGLFSRTSWPNHSSSGHGRQSR